MKKKLTVYQKPTCTKCRMTLRFLKERGAEFEAINYFETPLTEADLRSLLKKLGLSAREILSKEEPVAKQLGIGKKDFSDEEMIALMVRGHGRSALFHSGGLDSYPVRRACGLTRRNGTRGQGKQFLE